MILVQGLQHNYYQLYVCKTVIRNALYCVIVRCKHIFLTITIF
jgi:hypothetical protein